MSKSILRKEIAAPSQRLIIPGQQLIVTLRPKTPFTIIRPDKQKLEARWGQLPWKDLLFFAQELIHLFALVCNKDESYFEPQEYVALEGQLASAGLDIRFVGLKPLELEQISEAINAMTTFLKKISQINDADNPELPLSDPTHAEVIPNQIAKVIDGFLTDRGGKSIKIPIVFEHEDFRAELSGVFAPKPPITMNPHNQRVLIGLVDTISYSSRSIQVRPQHGPTEKLHFSIEDLLDDLHAAQKSQQPYTMTITDQFDARGKPVATLKSMHVSDLPLF